MFRGELRARFGVAGDSRVRRFFSLIHRKTWSVPDFLRFPARFPENQPLGNDRFYAEIEAVTGHRREPRKRGRPKKQPSDDPAPDLRQQELPL
jgi:hypothetical protein